MAQKYKNTITFVNHIVSLLYIALYNEQWKMCFAFCDLFFRVFPFVQLFGETFIRLHTCP